MHRALLVAAKVTAVAGCLAVAGAVAGPATASAAPLTGARAQADAASSLVYFFGSGTSYWAAAAMAESEAAQDGYWSCTIVSESTFPGIFGPTYNVTVGCTQF